MSTVEATDVRADEIWSLPTSDVCAEGQALNLASHNLSVLRNWISESGARCPWRGKREHAIRRINVPGASHRLHDSVHEVRLTNVR